MITIKVIERKTGIELHTEIRDDFTSAAVYCMANESEEISCLIKENKIERYTVTD